jgi:hypothetical protein
MYIFHRYLVTYQNTRQHLRPPMRTLETFTRLCVWVIITQILFNTSLVGNIYKN